jgi:hypothetical protein
MAACARTLNAYFISLMEEEGRYNANLIINLSSTEESGHCFEAIEKYREQTAFDPLSFSLMYLFIYLFVVQRLFCVVHSEVLVGHWHLIIHQND